MSNQSPQNYTGQTINQSVMVNGSVMTNPQITIPRTPYLLERYDFDKLIKGESLSLTFATILMGAAIGLFVNMLAKLIGSNIDETIVFDNWELFAFLISLGLMGICYLINYLVPNERRRIITVIKAHFKNS